MNVLADTHALHWYLADPARLGARAHTHMQQAEQDASGGILVSVASRIDLHYLVLSGKMTPELASTLWATTRLTDLNVRAVPITSKIVERFADPAITESLRDPWDRLIVATAIEFEVVLVTADQKIHDLAARGALAVAW